MSIAYESNTSLAFDTSVMKKAAREYKAVATDLRAMASKLDKSLKRLSGEGWTTPAGTAFYEMTKTNWKENIEKYASLLDTLNDILLKSAKDYDELMVDYVRTTKLKV
jgi:WXG100 family type VII secretion target